MDPDRHVGDHLRVSLIPPWQLMGWMGALRALDTLAGHAAHAHVHVCVSDSSQRAEGERVHVVNGLRVEWVGSERKQSLRS